MIINPRCSSDWHTKEPNRPPSYRTHPKSWTQDEIATLRRKWLAGQSAGEISKAIGRSRNSVLGKVDRLNYNTDAIAA